MINNICNNGNIHLIGIQDKYRSRTIEAVARGLDSASKLLKYTDPVDVAVFDSEDWDVHDRLNLSAHARLYYIDVKICYYRKNLDLSYLFNIDLPATLHHELSHVVRANSVGYAENLLQNFIDEGIACYIEESSGLVSERPYTKSIKDELKYLDEARVHFQDKITGSLHSRWFYGSEDLPEWIGYRIGYLMVKRYIEDTLIEIDKLVRTKAEIIVGL